MTGLIMVETCQVPWKVSLKIVDVSLQDFLKLFLFIEIDFNYYSKEIIYYYKSGLVTKRTRGIIVDALNCYFSIC